MAIQICVRTAFSEVPKKRLMRKFCLAGICRRRSRLLAGRGFPDRARDGVAVLLLQFRGAPIFLRFLAQHRGEPVDVLLGYPALDLVMIDRWLGRRRGLLALQSLVLGLLQLDIAPLGVGIGAQQLVRPRERGGVLLGARRRRDDGGRSLVADLAVNRYRGVALLGGPVLRRGELVEALGEIRFIHAGSDVVLVPLHRLRTPELRGRLVLRMLESRAGAWGPTSQRRPLFIWLSSCCSPRSVANLHRWFSPSYLLLPPSGAARWRQSLVSRQPQTHL
jgi:hypothetical protein